MAALDQRLAGPNVSLITVEEICYFQADNKYTMVVTAGDESVISKPIRELLAELDPEMFWQIHRSTVVNVNAIAAVHRHGRQLRGAAEAAPGGARRERAVRASLQADVVVGARAHGGRRRERETGAPGRPASHRRVCRRAAHRSRLRAGAQADDDAPVPLERVEVTGSRIRRIDGETALPVQIIKREEIDRSGVQTTEELLGLITANTGSQPEALSIGNDSNPGISSASLRGLGATRTLILLNGRRLENYAFADQGGSGVDLHAIPLAALDRVEVLKDGASAIYGSDAIAGVINFITKNDFRGVEATVYRGDTQQGGGSKTRATATVGVGDLAVDRFNAFAIFDYQKKGELLARDRSFTATDYRPGEGLDNTSNNSFPANIHVGPGRYVNPAAPTCTDVTVFDRGGCTFDTAKLVDILPPTEQWNVLARGTFAFDATHEIYVEGLYDRSRVRDVIAPTPVSFVLTDGTPIVLPTTSPFYPTGLGLTGDITDLRYRTVPLGPRIDDTVADQARVLVGTKGTAGAWDYDASAGYNVSHVTDRLLSGYIGTDAIANALASGLVNPFGDSGPVGDALLASTEARGIARRATGITRSADLHASRDLMQLPAGPLSIALGVDARRESLSQGLTALGSIATGSEAPSIGGARSAEAAYVELSVPIADGLDAQLALRDDHDSDFGSTLNPKVAVRWQPLRQVLLRASYGRGFRAPSLAELFTAQQTALTAFNDPLRCIAGDCEALTNVRVGGNPALRPERSEQGSAGIVFQPDRHVSVSIDFWRIHVGHQIAPLSADYALANDSAFEGTNVFRGPVDPANPSLPGPVTELVLLNENLGTSRTRGFDVELALHSDATPVGRFDVALTGTYVQGAEAQLGTPTFVNLRANDANDGAVSRWRQYLSLGWQYAAWTTTIHQSQQTGYDAAPDQTGNVRHIGGYQTWGIQVSYGGIRNTTVALGVDNLFDRDPPFVPGADFFQDNYNPAIADPRGRFFYGRITVRWP